MALLSTTSYSTHRKLMNVKLATNASNIELIYCYNLLQRQTWRVMVSCKQLTGLANYSTIARLK